MFRMFRAESFIFKLSLTTAIVVCAVWTQISVSAVSRAKSGPTVDGFGSTEAQAGERLIIRGSGFATQAEENRVWFGDLEATVIRATPTELEVATPYGVRTGRVSVRVTDQGDAVSREEIRARTSISGFVTDTAQPPQGLRGVMVEAVMRDGTKIEARTRPDGSFVLAGMTPGTVFLTINTTTSDSRLNYPTLPPFKKRVLPNQDNRLESPFALQQISEEGTGAAGSNLRSVSSKTIARAEQVRQLKTGCDQNRQNCVVLEISPDAIVSPQTINLTLVEQSRVPVKLPPGIFSSRIVQLTPFNADITPGAKLSFPNTDGLAPGMRVSLFRFDKEEEINSPNAFKELPSAALVSEDGARIETSGDEITEGSYYFVAARQRTTQAMGRVMDGTRPVQQVIAQVRGQSGFTKGDGVFSSPNVSVKTGDTLQAEVNHQRPAGGIVYTIKVREANAGGVTNFGDIPLNEINPNRPPRLTLPEQLTLTPGEATNVPFYAFDEQDGPNLIYQMIFIPVNLPEANPNPNFAAMILRPEAANNYNGMLRFTPGENDGGEYQFKLTVTDNGGANQLSVTKIMSLNVVGRPGKFTVSSSLACDAAAPSGPAVRLTWTPSANADSYDVLRNGTPIRRGLNSLSFEDKNIAAGESYSYRVIAVKGSKTREADAVSVSVPRDLCASSLVTISLPTVSAAQGAQTLIPVQLGDVNERGLVAFEFELSFDPKVLQFEELERTGTLSEGAVTLRKVFSVGELQVLRVVGYSIRPLGGANRDLLRLRFNVTGGNGVSSPLIWRQFVPNEGNLPVTALNGRLTVN